MWNCTSVKVTRKDGRRFPPEASLGVPTPHYYGTVNIKSPSSSKAVDLLLPVTITDELPDEGITITLTPKFVLDAVKSLGNDDLVITLPVTTRSPLRMEKSDHPGAFEILMPRR